MAFEGCLLLVLLIAVTCDCHPLWLNTNEYEGQGLRTGFGARGSGGIGVNFNLGAEGGFNPYNGGLLGFGKVNGGVGLDLGHSFDGYGYINDRGIRHSSDKSIQLGLDGGFGGAAFIGPGNGPLGVKTWVSGSKYINPTWEISGNRDTHFMSGPELRAIQYPWYRRNAGFSPNSY